MATGRLRAEWEQTASLMAWLSAMWCGRSFDPAVLMPAHLRPAPPPRRELTAEEKASETRIAMNVLGRAFERLR